MKWLKVLGLGLIGCWLAAWLAGGPVELAQAAPPSPHGPYSAVAADCAGCHRTHTAPGPVLENAANEIDLCLSCHDGTGSAYNSIEGVLQVDGDKYPTAAGPFAATVRHGPATSSHLLGASNYSPGGPAGVTPLSCGSCHDPHGNTNYRFIRTEIAWNGLKTAVTLTATVSGKMTQAEHVAYSSGSVQLCMACHPDYALHSGGQFSAGTRHPVNVPVGADYTPADLPLENGQLVCLTCHYAHGTTSVNTPASGLAGKSTALKRHDDWGACSQCHFNRP